jgi:hypothetical protein
MAHRLMRAAVCLVAMSSAASAFQLALDDRAIYEAIGMGQSRTERERVRFHEPYRLMVGRTPVDWIDVITPFHRLVLASEASARAGNRVFGQREALAALRDASGSLELVVELTFHPLNNFVGVPSYTVTLVGPQGANIQPLRVDRNPRFQARVKTPTPELPLPGAAPILGKGDPVLGGTLAVPFNGSTLDPTGTYAVVIAEAGKELARVEMNLGKLR